MEKITAIYCSKGKSKTVYQVTERRPVLCLTSSLAALSVVTEAAGAATPGNLKKSRIGDPILELLTWNLRGWGSSLLSHVQVSQPGPHFLKAICLSSQPDTKPQGLAWCHSLCASSWHLFSPKAELTAIPSLFIPFFERLGLRHVGS